jgi:predicted transcriptional regulator
MPSSNRAKKPLSELEHLIMDYIWPLGKSSADQVRRALARKRPMKESTVRTVLSRLEQKGYLTHYVEGRTYIYTPSEPAQSIAVRAVRQIVERLCGGSVWQLLLGMIDHELLSQEELRRLAEQVSQGKPEGERRR